MAPPDLAASQSLRIYHVDVDQAAATLIVSPGGHTLLVDSGRNGHGPRLLAALASAGVDRIDRFVATHYHEDHFGGIDEVVDAGIPVEAAFDRGDKAFLPTKTRNGATFAGYQRAVGNRAEHLTRGETIPLDPAMTVTCISSGGVVLGENTPPRHGADENDMSIGLLVTFGPFRYWIGGDVETATESKIAALDLVQDVDVYHANHHGADNGSSAEFLADLRPTVVIISNGSNTTFRHPRASTLGRLHALATPPAIFQLNRYLGSGDDGGNVADAFIGDVETRDADGTMLVTVDAEASAYTVSYGANVHRFRVKAPVSGRVVITRLLPDPSDGADRLRELVTIRNGGAAVDLTGWFLRDLGGRVWSLTQVGVLAADRTAGVRRDGMPMSLDNDGDTVELVDPAGKVIDAVTYLASRPGVEIATGH